MTFVTTTPICWTVLLVLINCWASAQIPISVSQNGYSGVTIAVSSRIAEDVTLIQKLKEWMTSASSVLYKATKNQLYFKDVTIVLPKTWSIKSEYKKISGEKFSRAHVRIDDENPVVGKTPYVYGQTVCGAPAQYMHLTTYLLYAGKNAGYGEIGDVFVHEWGHLRWGLFDEYASQEAADLEKPSGYYLEDGTWKSVRCTAKVRGTNLNVMTGKPCGITSDGLPEEHCIFVTDPNSPAVASLMGHQNILKMEHFCDSDDPSTNEDIRHNSRAPNNQNIICKGRSAWEVMREHVDFKGNTAGSSSLDTTPTFKIEIEADQSICLCLDVSGSMTNNQRSTRMYTASSNYLLNMVTSGTSVAIVKFSTKGVILNDLLQINSQSDRDKLVSSLPQTTGGSTSIGSGMLSCIEALNTSTNGLSGSMIYLVTDGEETNAPYIADVQPIILSSGIIVNSLAIGDKSDAQLGSISKASGGYSFYYSDQGTDAVLTDAFAATVVGDDLPIQIESCDFKVSNSAAFEKSVFIDETLGRDTEFQITSVGSALTVKVTGPSGTQYTQTSSAGGLTTLKLPNPTNGRRKRATNDQTGSHTVQVTTTSGNNISAVLNVQSKTRVAGESTISVQSWLSDNSHVYGSGSFPVLYVSVLKGMVPVLKCDVTAVMEGAEMSPLTPKDNGIGSDLKENDGIYSVYILSSLFKRNGRHSIKIFVQNLNNVAEVLVVKQTSPSIQSYNVLGTEKVGNFQRVLLSGEITITSYSSTPLPDTVKPSKIFIKLNSVELMGDSLKAVVEWKAVGDDLDIGIAKEYDIRMSTTYSQIQNNPRQATKVTSNVPTPASPGVIQQLTLSLSDTSKTHYLTLCAVDDSGNIGEYSNIVSISKLTDSSWYPGLANNVLISDTVIAGSFAGIIFLIIVLFIICAIRYCCSKTEPSPVDSKNILNDVEEPYEQRRRRRRQRNYQKNRQKEMDDSRRYDEPLPYFYPDYRYFANRGRRYMY